MKLAITVLALFALVSTAHAGDPLTPYARRIVISPEAPPSLSSELPAFLAANAVKDDDYHLIKGPPWPMHLVGVLAKPTKKPLVLVIVDPAAPKEPLLSFEVSSKQRIVMAHTEATIAAGFAAGKSYAVRLMLGKTVLAKSMLTLRD
ncbi:MAG: hypothetical protein ACKV2T_44100 [Kofleriaceae bacterium]